MFNKKISHRTKPSFVRVMAARNKPRLATNKPPAMKTQIAIKKERIEVGNNRNKKKNTTEIGIESNKDSVRKSPKKKTLCFEGDKKIAGSVL